jgi:AraC family transcriptional regulator
MQVMTKQTENHPLFSDTSRAILRFDCAGNTFKVSSLSEFYKPVSSKGFAIKYVTAGKERYTVDQQVYDICAGSYLLMNGERPVKVEIESKESVKGVCLDITAPLIAEVVSGYQQPGAAFTDPGLAAFFYTDQFLENKYAASGTRLGQCLRQISQSISAGHFTIDEINPELFYILAAQLVEDQAPLFRQLQNIPVVKTVTRKDLFRRLARGKDFMDSSFMLPLSIDAIAREAMMSEYHFFRLFRKVYTVSPHRYLVQKRLEAGRQMLLDHCSVSVAAVECGFADIYSFSKAFKKYFGCPPSALHTVK